MANPEHLKILEKGVKAWNKWRKENPNVCPDLSGTDLRRTNLNGADLVGVDFHSTFGYGLFIVDTDFSETDFRKAYFQDCKFFGDNFKKANLAESRFWGCEFPNANFEYANLKKANLYMSVLGANFHRADLRDADLSCCLLIHAKLHEANITGVRLWGTARDFWKIKDVRCDYVYWDGPGKQRCPKERDFALGEFERLYAALPSIEYIFENGMTPLDPLIMDRVVQAIHERRPEFDIRIDSINARGLAPSIKFTVQYEEYKEPALEEVRTEYEGKIKRLESEMDRYLQLVSSNWDFPQKRRKPVEHEYVKQLYQLLAQAMDNNRLLGLLLGQAIDKAGDKLITAGPGAIVATDGSTISIEQHIHNALELQKAIADEPEESKSFAKVAKKTALDIIGGAIKDIAKGQVKEAAKQIIELGKDLGPIIAKMAAYSFFSNIGG